MEVITISNKKMMEFTLIDVIERQIIFTETNTVFDKKDFEDYNAGKFTAYNEMKADVKELNEDEFVEKYLKKMKRLSKQVEKEEIGDTREVERLSGYNNAIVSIMMFIDPIFEYEL